VIPVTLALAVLAALIPLSPARADVEITFEGGGWGHSVGLSQYGAYGMALEGASWQDIVTHYYTGTTVGDLDTATADLPLWIGLEQERSRITLTVFRTWLADPVPVVFTQDGERLSAGPGTRVVVEDLGDGTCRISAGSTVLEGSCAVDVAWDGFEDSPSVGLELAGCTLPDWNASSGVIYRPCRYARGALHLRPDNAAGLDLALEIGIEDYLLGISEMPYAWGTAGGAAALQAQAVAARSYAVHRTLERGDAADRPWCWCHLYDTPVDQNYVGWGHGQAAWTDAVRNTAGKVIHHPSALWNGRPMPIEAFYSSSTFGWTEASEHGFSVAVPYLRPVDDHWAGLSAVGNPNFRWIRTFSGADLGGRLGMGLVTGAEVTACSTTGAALEITFTESAGTRSFATRDLRNLLGLRSMQVFNVGSPPGAVPPCSGPAVATPADGGPVTLGGVFLDDDALDESTGDGDGVAECREAVEVRTSLTNGGAALYDLTARVATDDPYVTILWNTDSWVPDIATGGTVVHSNDWDLALSPDTPDGHEVHLTVWVEAANGGPWSIDAAFPVACEISTAPGSEPGPAIAGVADGDGDGIGDAAALVAGAGGLPRLAIGGSGGGIVADVLLDRPGLEPVDVVVAGDVGGSPVPDIAVLLRNPEGRDLFLVIDGETGTILTERGLGKAFEWIDVEAVPDTGGTPAPDLVFLATTPGAANRVFVFDAGSGYRLGRFPFARRVTSLDLEVAGDTAGSPTPEVAALVTLTNGATAAFVFDLEQEDRITTIRFGKGLAAAGLEVLPAGDGTAPDLAVAGVKWEAGRLIVRDAADNRKVTAMSVPLTSVADVEALSLPGGGAGIALLGGGADGESLLVVDPSSRRVVSAPPVPAGSEDVAVLGDGAALAVLSLSGDAPAIAVVDTAAGGRLADIVLP
jgi:SpoIID/LytB domain protein